MNTENEQLLKDSSHHSKQTDHELKEQALVSTKVQHTKHIMQIMEANPFQTINLILTGYSRSCGIKIISDIIVFMSQYCNFKDQWDLSNHSRFLIIHQNKQRVQVYKKSDYHSIRGSAKKFFFGTTLIDLYQDYNFMHQWQFHLQSISRHSKRGKHICCGIGIVNVNDIQRLIEKDHRVRNIKKREMESAVSNNSMNGLIGFECIAFGEELVYDRYYANTEWRMGNYGREIKTLQRGHCLNDKGIMEQVSGNHNELTSKQCCFMNQDIVTMIINCKEKLLTLLVVNKLDQGGSIRMYRKSLDDVYGRYTLGVWLKHPGNKIDMIQSFVIGDYN